jgi:hypothetical protein
VVENEGQAAGLVRSGHYRDLVPLPRPRWRWRDVAAAYVDLLDHIDDAICRSLPMGEFRTGR